jgi:hypothetical protein
MSTKRGGKRGRRLGSKNKKTILREMAAAADETPLAFMLAIMRDPRQKQRDRFEAAKAAAPYVHPKLIAHDTSGDIVRQFVAQMPEKAPDAEAWVEEHAPPEHAPRGDPTKH